MLKWFNALSIRWQLISATVLTTAVTLIIAAAVIAGYDAQTYRRQKVEEVGSQASILAASMVASLEFNDTAATTEYLNAFSANEEIDAAAAYGADGKVVAHYVRVDGPGQSVPQAVEKTGSWLRSDHVTVIAPVTSDSGKIGSVYLRARIQPLATRLARYALIVLLIGSASLAVILPFALRLHAVISNPIEELATKNAIIKATFDEIDHGVLVVDPQMRIISLNDRYLTMFQIPGGHLRVGANLEEYIKNDHTQQGTGGSHFENQLERLRATEQFRSELALADGRTIECRHTPLPQGGFVRTYTDISEEKLLQDALQRAKENAEEMARAKSKFLAAMSHEIRTPMNGVIGVVELLCSTPLNDDQKQMVEIIRQSGISLLDVINDILDYSKIEAGKMSLESTAFSLADTVETTAALVAAQAQSKVLDIVCFVDPAIDAVVQGDPVRTRQIILNLMSNAVKFTESGAVSVEASIDSLDENKITVLFEVTDTGIGIEPANQARLFQAFQQADYSTTRRYGGTGLGLSICSNLVELMGGAIGLRSVPGAGSTFWVKIPFARVPVSERSSPFSKYDGVLSGLRVLVCDTIIPRPKAAIYLRAAGAEVIEARDIIDIPRLLDGQARSGRRVDAAIVRVRVGDERTLAFIENLGQRADLRNTAFVILVPHMSSGMAKVTTNISLSRVVSSPLRRAKFYDAVALAAGRMPAEEGIASQPAILDFSLPSVDRAAALGTLILVAEDNKTNQFVIQSQLHKLGFAAEFVNDGREAWESLQSREGRYGLLLTDCHMPFIDGYKLTGLVRDQELTSKRRLPIIALTANALEGADAICRAAGMDDYLSKPTTLQALEAMVSKWLPRAASLRSPIAPPNTDIGPPRNAHFGNGAARVDTQSMSPAVPKTPMKNAPINMAAFTEFHTSIGPENIGKFLRIFLDTEEATPGNLQRFIQNRDDVGLASAAHGAKGTAAAICAESLRGLCANLESLARKQDWAGAIDLVPRIEPEFRDVREFIEAFLETR